MVYRKPKYTDQYLNYSVDHQRKESFISFLFNIEYSIITNKDDVTKENARLNHVLKENGYLESIISKIVKRISNNYSLSQSQEQMQATDIQVEEIRMSVNILYIEDTSEKLWVYTQISIRQLDPLPTL